MGGGGGILLVGGGGETVLGVRSDNSIVFEGVLI